MMSQEQYEQIERYLAGQLSESERQTFEQQLTKDTDLRETVAIHRDMATLTVHSPKDNLRVQLSTTAELFDKNGKEKKDTDTSKWWLLLLLPLLLGVFWWQTRPASSFKDTSTSLPTIEDKSANDLPVPASITPPGEQESSAPTLPTTDAPKVESPPTQVPSTTNRPVAANFAPNPVIESAMGTFLRGDFALTIDNTATQELRLNQGKTEWIISGELDTHLSPGDDFELLLSIYNNKTEAYQNNQTIYQNQINFKSTASPWAFVEAIDLGVSPGLYYYLIMDDFSGAVLGGGKLIIR